MLPGNTTPASTLARVSPWLVLLAIAIAMGRIVSHEFSNWDDQLTLSGNALYNPPAMAALKPIWSRVEYGLYTPVTRTFWLAQAMLAYVPTSDAKGVHLNPWVFHSVSLLLHGTSALIVLRLLRTLGFKPLACLIAALVFAVHPLQVETVAWTSGQKDLLAWCLVLGAILLHATSSRWTLPTSIAIAALYATAFLSKPSAMVLPAFLVVIDLTMRQRSLRETVLRTAVLWIMLVPMLIVTKYAQPAPETFATPLHLRPIIAGDAITFYLGKIAAPLNLSVIYDRRPEVVLAGGWGMMTAAIAALLAAFVACIARRAKPLAGAAAIFVIGVAPVLGFTPFLFQAISTTADHYMYASMLGVAISVAFIVHRLASNRLAASVGGVVIVLLIVRSVVAAGVWESNMTLFQNAVRVSPRSVVAWNNLGAEYLVEPHRDVRAAQQAFEESVARGKFTQLAGGNLVLVYLELADPAAAQAMAFRTLEAAEKVPGATRATVANDALVLAERFASFGAADFGLPIAREAASRSTSAHAQVWLKSFAAQAAADTQRRSRATAASAPASATQP